MTMPAHENLPRELLEAVVLQAPDALICADIEGSIVAWNAGAERIFGHTPAEAIGRSLDIIIPDRFRHAHWEAYNHSIARGRTRHPAGRVLTTRALHRNGNRLYVDLSFGLLKNAAGTVIGVMAIARDSTERHAAARAS